MREETVAIGALRLDCGQTLRAVEQRVTVYGTPAADGSNVVLVEHALTGSSRAADWWPGIVGDGALFDPREWCVVGINALGSCYGSTRTSQRITVRDVVRAEMLALRELGLERVELVIGGSLGGMRALQWALAAPQRIGNAVLVGAHDHHSAMGIALNALQREALVLDPVRGLRLARKLAMLSYKSEELFNARHARRGDRGGKACFDVEGYLERQADLFEARMDAASYATLTHAMDSFDVRNAGDWLLNGGGTRKPRLTFVGITSDWLFRPQDVRAAAQRFALLGFDAQYLEFQSRHGHDAFLAEPNSLRAILEPLIRTPATAAARSNRC
ncbi:MAG: alpha/beta fold hydrolase [Candidatus Cybelea sp.]